ncbi:TPA: hypothetical protein DDZ86_05275 [Candidatus Dependentiae bacterium]|nr:hypothetical protein [Candidatus Dependentiae bacterium]
MKNIKIFALLSALLVTSIHHLHAGTIHDLVEAKDLQGLANHLMYTKNNSNSFNIDALDNQGRTPLLCACQKKYTEIAWLLITKGANVNASCLAGPNAEVTPLLWACKHNNFDLAKFFILNGANVNASRSVGLNTGLTPLLIACNNNNTELATLLIQQNANVNASVSTGPGAGMTPLLSACCNNNTKLAKLLIQQNANINVSIPTGPSAGTTPLIYACSKNNTEIAKILIQKGANINVSTSAGPNAGITPLLWACKNNNFDLAKLLIQKGANVNASIPTGTNAGQTALKIIFTTWSTELQAKFFQSLIPTKENQNNALQSSFISLVASPKIAEKYNPLTSTTLSMEVIPLPIENQKKLIKICNAFLSSFLTRTHPASMPKDLLSNKANELCKKICTTTPFDWTLKYHFKITKEQFYNLYKLLSFARAAQRKTNLSEEEQERIVPYKKFNDITIRFRANRGNKRKEIETSKTNGSSKNKKKKLTK